MHAARLRGERRVQRHDVGGARQRRPASRARSTYAGKSPSIRYGSNATTRLNISRADVRHALADPAEADDAERQLAGPPQRARTTGNASFRRVMSR